MSAITTVILTVMSLPALLFPKLLVLPFIAFMIGLFGWFRLRGRDHEFVGLKFARVATVLSIVLFVAGTARAAYEYATEVPEGYFRLSFNDLQPDPRYPQLPIPPSAAELDGKEVWVAGYVHPGVPRRKGIRQFILVPDMKTCCFGGQPELTDMIEVTLDGDDRIDYSYSRRKLTGKLKVNRYKKAVANLDGVYYELQADGVVLK